MQIFLSYAYEDRAFAAPLRDALEAAGISVFFDATSLRAGEGWENALEDALGRSDGLICLWSKNGHESPWVQRELMTFMVRTTRNKTGKAILVRLDNRESAHASVQQIDESGLKEAYGAGRAETFSFGDIATRLQVAFAGRGNIRQLPVALFTLTSDDVSLLGEQERINLQNRFGLDDAAMKNRYKKNRLDWRPFPGTVTIRGYLDRAALSINSKLREYSIDWEFPPDAFWIDKEPGVVDLDAVRQFAARVISAETGIVVVDPAAVTSLAIRNRLGLFQRCARSANVAIIALQLNDDSAQISQFHQWLVVHANAVLDPFMEPDPKEVPTARFGIGLNGAEFDRFLRSSVFSAVGGTRRGDSSAFTRY